MFDRFNRKIDYLRISVTDRCNLRCIYCMPEQGIALKRHRDILSYEGMVAIARGAVRLGIKKIRLTGGEPLVRKDVVCLISRLRSIKELKELTLTTNGVLLDKLAVQLQSAGLDRINISLDTLDPEKYLKLTRIGILDDVLRGIDAVINAGFENTKLNMVLMPGINTDEVADLQDFCRQKGLILQRINHYSLDGRKSRAGMGMGFAAERPLSCASCNRIRLTADGHFKPCLFSNLEIPVNMDDIAGSIRKTVLLKPEKGSSCTVRQNWQIGG
jgi:cyclic pyranopterin phosphate synthase